MNYYNDTDYHTNPETGFSVDVFVSEIGTNNLKHELQKRWDHVEVTQLIEGNCPPLQLDALEASLKGVRGVATLNHEPIKLERLWQRTQTVLDCLLEAGWTVHAGAADGVCCIVLTNSEAPSLEGVAIPVDVPAPIERSIAVIGAFFDGLKMIGH